MKNLSLALATLALLLGITAEASAQRNKTTCGADVAVFVTIAGSYTAPGGYALVSDAIDGGVYRNAAKGNDKITAIFQVDNCTHDFTMNLNFSKRSMFALLKDAVGNEMVKRGNFFNFDRVHSVPLTADVPGFLASTFCTEGVVRNAGGAIRRNADGSYQDNYGGCDVDEQGLGFVRRAGSLSLDGDERLSFNVSPIDHADACPDETKPNCGASFVRVYHPDARTWYVRSEPPANAAYRVWAGGEYVPMSNQQVPFEIKVTRP